MQFGMWEIIIIIALVLLVFGAGKIPRLMSDVAKGIKAFKHGMSEEEEAPKAKKTSGKKKPQKPSPSSKKKPKNK